MIKQYFDIDRDGFKFKVALDNPEENLNYVEFWNGFVSHWERFTLDWIKSYSNTSKSFLDIGAWIGPTSLWASNYFKSVYAFEPDPIAFKYLKLNSELNSNNIKFYNAAISNEKGNIPLFSRSGFGSSMTSMYTGDNSGVYAEAFSLEDAIQLDNFSLIKIDIEGGERLIIDKFCEMMESNPIDTIFSFHHSFYADPDNDFNHIIKKLSTIYSSFILENGSNVDPFNIPFGFPTVLLKV